MIELIKLAAVLAAMLPAFASAGGESTMTRFAQIKEEIEANCGECYGASKERFVKAVRDLEQLVASGFADPIALKLLAKSYETWAFVYADSQTPESKEKLRAARNLYADLTKQVPNDPGVWASYAGLIENPREALEPLKRAEALSPQDASIKFSLGMLYSHGLNDPQTGATLLKKAVELEDGPSKLTYLEQLAEVYELTGNTARAAETRSRMREFEQVLREKSRPQQQER